MRSCHKRKEEGSRSFIRAPGSSMATDRQIVTNTLTLHHFYPFPGPQAGGLAVQVQQRCPKDDDCCLTDSN